MCCLRSRSWFRTGDASKNNVHSDSMWTTHFGVGGLVTQFDKGSTHCCGFNDRHIIRQHSSRCSNQIGVVFRVCSRYFALRCRHRFDCFTISVLLSLVDTGLLYFSIMGKRPDDSNHANTHAQTHTWRPMSYASDVHEHIRTVCSCRLDKNR